MQRFFKPFKKGMWCFPCVSFSRCPNKADMPVLPTDSLPALWRSHPLALNKQLDYIRICQHEISYLLEHAVCVVDDNAHSEQLSSENKFACFQSSRVQYNDNMLVCMISLYASPLPSAQNGLCSGSVAPTLRLIASVKLPETFGTRLMIRIINLKCCGVSVFG